jgi:transposase
MAGESGKALAKELQISGSHLSQWWAMYRRYGAEGLRPAQRPRNTGAKLEPLAKAEDLARSQQLICELERKIGQQQIELDFFRQALRRVEDARRPSDRPGVPASTPSSRQ